MARGGFHNKGGRGGGGPRGGGGGGRGGPRGGGRGGPRGGGRGGPRGPNVRTPQHVILLDDGRLVTENLVPGERVSDEDLLTIRGREHRAWNPTRSKLGAYVLKGGRNFQVTPKSRVLYLGAANGTTVSHLSDVLRDGACFAVEFSSRSFRDLLRVAKPRPNLHPVLADAWRPELYARFVTGVDLVFQDIAQRQQAAIFARNIERYKPPVGILTVKARSVDVAKDPRQVYEDVAEELERTTSYRIDEMVDLGPYEKDHAALVVRPK